MSKRAETLGKWALNGAAACLAGTALLFALFAAGPPPPPELLPPAVRALAYLL